MTATAETTRPAIALDGLPALVRRELIRNCGGSRENAARVVARLTPRKLALFAIRGEAVVGYLDHDRRVRMRRWRWLHADSMTRGPRPPARAKIGDFMERLSRTKGVRISHRRYNDWLNSYCGGGLPLLAQDGRGVRRRGFKPVDGRLFARLLSLVGKGMSIAGADTFLRPQALAGDLPWVSLGTLQSRVREWRKQTRAVEAAAK